MNDDAYQIASDGIPNLIERMMDAGASFDEAVHELREQIDTACLNSHEYE